MGINSLTVYLQCQVLCNIPVRKAPRLVIRLDFAIEQGLIMITHDLKHELEAIFSQLQQQGKEPSVALVKSRLSTPLPMPALIAAIKSWKQTQQVPKLDNQQQANISDQQRITQLEQQVALLLKRIEQLEQITNNTANN